MDTLLHRHCNLYHDFPDFDANEETHLAKYKDGDKTLDDVIDIRILFLFCFLECYNRRSCLETKLETFSYFRRLLRLIKITAILTFFPRLESFFTVIDFTLEELQT